MQTLYQKQNGDRIHVSHDAYEQMSLRYGKRISHILRNKTLTIFCLRGNERAYVDRGPRLGGGDRMSNPYDYIGVGK